MRDRFPKVFDPKKPTQGNGTSLLQLSESISAGDGVEWDGLSLPRIEKKREKEKKGFTILVWSLPFNLPDLGDPTES